MIIPGLNQTLQSVGDLSEIADALTAIGETQRQIASLPCSKHPDRLIVAIAPTLEHARLCQECLDALMEKNDDGTVRIDVRRLGESAGYEPAVDAEGLGAPSTLRTGEEPRACDREDVSSALAIAFGGLRLWGDTESGVDTGADDREPDGAGGDAGGAPLLPDTEDVYFDREHLRSGYRGKKR